MSAKPTWAFLDGWSLHLYIHLFYTCRLGLTVYPWKIMEGKPQSHSILVLHYFRYPWQNSTNSTCTHAPQKKKKRYATCGSRWPSIVRRTPGTARIRERSKCIKGFIFSLPTSLPLTKNKHARFAIIARYHTCW